MAMADYNATKQWPRFNNATWTSSFQSACESWWTGLGESKTYYGATNCSGDTCTCSEARTGPPWCAAGVTCGGGQGPVLTRQYQCPNGGTLSGSICIHTCPAGQVEQPNGTCQQSCPAAGTLSGIVVTGDITGAFACLGGCKYQWLSASNQYIRNGVHVSAGIGSSTSEICTGGEQTASTAEPDPPTRCPTGQCAGTVNGTTICVPCGDSTPGKTTTTTTATNADGSKSTTTTTTTNTGTGSTTTSTTTTTAPDGTPTGTTTKTETGQPEKKNEIDDFCTQNPNLSICKESSFGGGCGSFSCDGDAVQCAMAKEQHKRNCTMFDTDTAESTLGKQAAAGNDPQAPNYPTAPGKVETVNLATAIDTTNPFAGGCLQDKSFQIMTTTLVIPFSNICPFLETMGQIVLAFSLLMAARIAFSGV